MPNEHDAERVAREFAGKLAARARHVCMLLGAGASVSAGLPTVAELEAIVTNSLPDPFKGMLTDLLVGRNLEQALSRIRRIRNLLGAGETLSGMTAAQATELDQKVCASVTTAVDAAGKDITAFVNLASWAGRMETHRPIELFTVNYDLLIEAGLEELGVPYFDSFVGGVRGRFAPELIEPCGRARRNSAPSRIRSALEASWLDQLDGQDDRSEARDRSDRARGRRGRRDLSVRREVRGVSSAPLRCFDRPVPARLGRARDNHLGLGLLVR